MTQDDSSPEGGGGGVERGTKILQQRNETLA